MPAAAFRLIVRTGPNPGVVIDLTKEVSMMGRDVTNDVVLGDAEVSRQHARITRTPAGYVLEDLGSTNGTFVNGDRLAAPRVLNAGDLLGLGEIVTLTFELNFAGIGRHRDGSPRRQGDRRTARASSCARAASCACGCRAGPGRCRRGTCSSRESRHPALDLRRLRLPAPDGVVRRPAVRAGCLLPRPAVRPAQGFGLLTPVDVSWGGRRPPRRFPTPDGPPGGGESLVAGNPYNEFGRTVKPAARKWSEPMEMEITFPGAPSGRPPSDRMWCTPTSHRPAVVRARRPRRSKCSCRRWERAPASTSSASCASAASPPRACA